MFPDRRCVQAIVAMCFACAAILLWCRTKPAIERDGCCAASVEPATPEFPCMDHGCGCATSEQCLTACCCFGGGSHATQAPAEIELEFVAREPHAAVFSSAITSTDAVMSADCSCGRVPRSIASAPAPASVSIDSLVPKFEPADALPLRIGLLSASYSDRRPSPAAPPPRRSVLCS